VKTRPSLPGVLREDEFSAVIASIGEMMRESYFLTVQEQDTLRQTILNLNLAERLYRTHYIKLDSARNLLSMIDRSLHAIQSNPAIEDPKQMISRR